MKAQVEDKSEDREDEEEGLYTVIAAVSGYGDDEVVDWFDIFPSEPCL